METQFNLNVTELDTLRSLEKYKVMQEVIF